VTDTKFRGKGIATAILEHFFTLPQYEDYYIEEVADINTNALNLYKRLGYQEFARIKTNHVDKTGINYMISLKCHKKSQV
jgi:ribosomal protein S18 acetylase RimI-like enzyme